MPRGSEDGLCRVRMLLGGEMAPIIGKLQIAVGIFQESPHDQLLAAGAAAEGFVKFVGPGSGFDLGAGGDPAEDAGGDPIADGQLAGDFGIELHQILQVGLRDGADSPKDDDSHRSGIGGNAVEIHGLFGK